MGNKELHKVDVERNNIFLQGYVCALTVIIRMDEQVSTSTKELFDMGVGKLTLAALRDRGIEEGDLDILREYWHELHNNIT